MLFFYTINYKISFELTSTKFFFVPTPFNTNGSDRYPLRRAFCTFNHIMARITKIASHTYR